MKLLYISDTDRVHDRRFIAAYRDAGLDVESVCLAGMADPIAQSGDAIRRFEPSVVHAGPMTTAAWAAAMAGADPLVSMSWGSDVLRDAVTSAGLRERVQYVATASSLVQCDSLPVEDALVREYGVPRELIVRFPWGIDVNRFAPGPERSGLRSRLCIREDDHVVLSTRNFEEVYDIPCVLSAFALAAARLPRLRLVMLGSGTGLEAAGRYVAENGLQDRVAFIGHVDNDELPEYFRLADVYISCSLSDGASVSLLEALATGRPVVVSDIPGNREWVVPHVNGWLAQPRDAKAFTDAIISAAGLTGDQKAAVGTANRLVATERADWSRNVVRLIHAVTELG